MRALFTAKQAMKDAHVLLELLAAEGYSFQQECRGGVSMCNGCRRREAARKQVVEVKILLGVALTEVQVEIKEKMPFVKKLNRAVKAPKKGKRRGQRNIR